ncbi:MAG: efflux RND transporter periplasmic adaptor subunit [Acidobacteria bacterium]|nr:efflux RND transporter periplasmic adaptor subunit [Acidobacteriota bacterium]
MRFQGIGQGHREASRLMIALLTAALGAAVSGCAKKEAPPPPPPVAVKVGTVLQKDVPIYVEAIGQTRGSTEIEVRARVEGFIQTIDFKEGNPVKRGQLLYTIDSQPFEAALAQAKGSLAEAQAQFARARQDVVRYEPLVAKNAISRQEYETAVAVQQAAEASVDAAKAAVQRAEVDLSYTKVVAPEDGLVGRTEVYPGTLVGRGQSTLLTHISQIEKIHVRFTMTEKDYLYFARRREQRGMSEQAPTTSLELVLADASVHPEKGRIVFADRNVDPTTGTIMMEAAFENPGSIVRPGQYARVRAAVDIKKDALLVPQRAISELQGIYNLAVVGADQTIEIRPVQMGARVGTLWVVESGLKAGENVVVEGLQKVRPGVKVTPEMVKIEEGSGAPPPPAAPAKAKAEAKGAQG